MPTTIKKTAHIPLSVAHMKSAIKQPSRRTSHINAKSDFGIGVEPDGHACAIWMQSQFLARVRLAIASWADTDPQQLNDDLNLQDLSRERWGVRQQAALIKSVNDHYVFAPFCSAMVSPSALIPGNTTVSQLERLIWSLQNPRTPCWELI